MSANLLRSTSVSAGRELQNTDVRRKLDEATRRGWLEIGRRFCRVGLLVASDSMMMALSTFVAAVILPTLWLPAGSDVIRAWMLMLLFVQPLTIGVAGAYLPGHNRVSFGRISIGVTAAAAIALVQVQLLGAGVSFASAAISVAAHLPVAIAAVFGGRLAFDAAVRYAYRQGLYQRRVLVIGSEREMAKMSRILRDQDAAEINIVGRLSPTHRPEAGAIDVVADLEAAVRAHRAWGVIVASSNLSFEALETIFNRCFELGVAVSLVPKTLHKYGPRLELRKTKVGALLQLHPRELGIPQLTIKRFMDISLSIALLLVLWPFFIAIAVAIKLDTRGPVLFRQTRAGLGGQPFGMYKFRTMVADADDIKAQLGHLNESGDPRLFKIRDDPRVTRVGRLLRRTSLDEFPQLFNVLSGEMSLIGPRPFFPEDLAGYLDHHFERLSVLPGITGWWQVRGRSSVLNFEEVVRLDREYIDQWSVWFDLKILLLTLPTVVRRTGAY